MKVPFTNGVVTVCTKLLLPSPLLQALSMGMVGPQPTRKRHLSSAYERPQVRPCGSPAICAVAVAENKKPRKQRNGTRRARDMDSPFLSLVHGNFFALESLRPEGSRKANG